MKPFALLLLFGFWGVQLAAQPASSEPSVNLSGYLETYYGYDFALPEDHLRPGFIYSHNRTNEFQLNVGFLKAAYQRERTRANLALGVGTYFNANLAAEPGVLRNIFEANAGVKLSSSAEWWVDAGIFGSHIGFESAIGKDCWTLTRSMVADNSPYYESGVKMTYTSRDQRWTLVGLILNGWQRIQRVDGNNRLAFGHQVQFKPSAKVTLNSSSFVGSDKPDAAKQPRIYHNFYGQFQLTPALGVILGFDIGGEKKPTPQSGWNTWYTPVVIARVQAGKQGFLAGRIEYFSDPGGVIIGTAVPAGFRSWGYSLNYDRQVTEQMLWRIEFKTFQSPDQIYRNRNAEPSGANGVLSTALTLAF